MTSDASMTYGTMEWHTETHDIHDLDTFANE